VTGEFYVYHHKRGDDGRVFYVGKGKGNRAFSSLHRNRWWKFIVAKHGFCAELIATGMSEQEAFAFERAEISRIGRDNLCNNSDGGEGPAGAKHSEEACAQKSAVMRDVWEASPDRKSAVADAFRGRWADPEYRLRVTEAQRQSHQRIDVRLGKIAAMRKAYAKPVRCIGTGVEYDTIADAVDWLRSCGKHKAVSCTISYAASGKRPSAYGFKWEYL